ncbi:MAG: hypothetical protein JJT81_09630 [Rubellimicrobium sp.]|nr:hypothetical protein [Rubellimicrobium sp.]
MDLRWLLRIRQLVQRPPSRRQAVLILVTIAVCIAIVVIEAQVGWPDAFTTQRARRPAIQPLP